MTETFEWRGKQLELLDHPYNATILNERSVEVPITLAWIAGQHGVGLEVGNVLSHYVPVNHRIVDLYEEAEGVDNIDVLDIEGEYDWIVAISTLEHIYSEESPHPNAAVTAIVHLFGLLKPRGQLFVTIPCGQNPFIDVAILSEEMFALHQGTMLLEEDVWAWHEETVIWRPARENGWASAVWIGTWLNQ